MTAAGAAHAVSFAKQRDALNDPNCGPARKIDAVLKIFERDLFKPIADLSGIKPALLRSLASWSETVRDSRNTLHFLAVPATPNTYEKVAVLMLGAADPLRTLYALNAVATANRI